MLSFYHDSQDCYEKFTTSFFPPNSKCYGFSFETNISMIIFATTKTKATVFEINALSSEWEQMRIRCKVNSSNFVNDEGVSGFPYIGWTFRCDPHIEEKNSFQIMWGFAVFHIDACLLLNGIQYNSYCFEAENISSSHRL